MEDNFNLNEYLENNPLLNEGQKLTEEQINKANTFFEKWGPNGEKGKEFKKAIEDLKNAYNKKHGL